MRLVPFVYQLQKLNKRTRHLIEVELDDVGERGFDLEAHYSEIDLLSAKNAVLGQIPIQGTTGPSSPGADDLSAAARAISDREPVRRVAVETFHRRLRS